MKKIDITVLLLALSVLVSAAQAVELDPGQTMMINCSGTNGTTTVKCRSASNQTGQCVIGHTMYPGQRYVRSDGICDIDFYCEEYQANNSNVEDKTYTLDFSVRKDRGSTSVDVSAVFKDFRGAVVRSMEFPMLSKNTTIYNTEYVEFACPTEVIFDLDYKSCSAYLDQYFEDTSPAFMQLATGSTDCQKALIECEAGHRAELSKANDYKDQLQDCQTQKATAETLKLEAQNAAQLQVDRMTGEVTAVKQTRVEMWAFWLAVLGWPVWIITVLFGFVLSKPGGGK